MRKTKSIAKKANHNFKTGSFKMFDDDNNMIYFEDKKRFWIKYIYDANKKIVYHEDSTGFWSKSKYTNNKLSYRETSCGYKKEY